MYDPKHSTYYQIEGSGCLRISGPDRLVFLQRQTTNDLELLTPDRSLVTVLTSPTGRILDVLWVIEENNDAFLVITLPGQVQQTTDFLNSRIFFMDKVSVENISHDFVQIDLIGSRTQDFLQEIGFQHEIGPDQILTKNLRDTPIRVLFHQDLGSRILVASTQTDPLTDFLKEKDILPLSAGEFEIMRVERGIPAAGHELVEDYTPLEIGYHWAISDSKGCYTGQEVIARQVNYDKITRQLIGLTTSSIPNIDSTLYARENNQPVGKITSAVLSPRFGSIALSVVKRPYHEPGSDLFLKDGDREIEAETNTLPFE
jgi:folate-binding protein YgfZ